MIKRNVQGYTLLEMMITTAILLILITVGVPGMQEFIKNNRILASTSHIMTSIKSARSEAMTQRSFVTVCMSADGATCGGSWTEGHIAFVDTDADGTVDAGEQVFLANRQESVDVTITYSGGDFIRFDRRGRAVGSSGLMLFCDDRGTPNARGITVEPIGRSMVAGGALVCP